MQPVRRHGFTLLEIMIVVSVIGLLATIAIPAFSKARQNSRRSTCLTSLRQIEGAKDTWAFETGQPGGGTVTWNDILPYEALAKPPGRCA